MKPHSLRRGLWLANLVLGVAVIGVAAWFVLKVRPAVAKVANRKHSERPAEFEKLRKDYEGQRMSGLKWKPPAPVTEADIKQVVLRKDYADKKPRHWIFSGPLPPEDRPDVEVVDRGPPPPEGLDVLGSISALIYTPPDGTTILFKFGGKSLAFGVGDFVRKSDTDPARFKITKVREKSPKAFEITYDVYGKDDKDKPERTGTMMYDQSDSDGFPSFLRPDVPAKPTKGATGVTGPDGKTPAKDGAKGGPTEGDATKGDPTKGDPTKGDAAKKDDATDESGAKVIDVSKTSSALTLQDLKPEIEYNPRNRSQRAIKFDSNSYKYFKGKNAKSMAGTVKTSVAKDKAGRVIGLRITGFAKDAPADVFDVRRGDILVSINGQKVTTRSDAVRVAESIKPNSLVTVVIDRNGKNVTYRVDASDPKNRRKVRYFDNLK